MHIGITIPNLHGGGAEFVARRWIAESHAQGHKITIYAYDRKQPQVDLPNGTIVRRFSSRGGLLRPLILPIWLRWRIQRDGPDIVLSMLTYSNVVTLLGLTVGKRVPVPVMVSERNVPSLLTITSRRRDKVTVSLARCLYRRASGVLAISHPVAGDLVSAFHVSADRLFVVPNPVVPSSPTTGSASSPPKQLHLALVGRHVYQKRPHLFLAVLGELAQRGIPVRGTVIGDGPLRAAMELESSRLGLSVSFLGWREPWWSAVADVDCLLLTARVEGFANVLVEAAAAGIPSVASSRALGVADAIVPGITGELTISDSPRDYADAVLRAAALTVSRTAPLQGWLNHYSTEKSTAALLAALQSTVERSRDGGTLPSRRESVNRREALAITTRTPQSLHYDH